jgi:hypothetical protein
MKTKLKFIASSVTNPLLLKTKLQKHSRLGLLATLTMLLILNMKFQTLSIESIQRSRIPIGSRP